jgi:hypothetical protein
MPTNSARLRPAIAWIAHAHAPTSFGLSKYAVVSTAAIPNQTYQGMLHFSADRVATLTRPPPNKALQLTGLRVL